MLHDDQWDGYPAERARLAGELRARGERAGAPLCSPATSTRRGRSRALRRRHGEPVAVEVTTPAVSSAAMGRAHLPGMWRLLDRAANASPHVRWADVTERGYADRPHARRVTATWWFVHPYDDDPAARAEPACLPLRAGGVAAPVLERASP